MSLSGPTYDDGVPIWPNQPDECSHAEFIWMAGPGPYPDGHLACALCGTPAADIEPAGLRRAGDQP